MERMQQNPEVDVDLETRRSLVLDFECMLGEIYETTPWNDGNVLSVINLQELGNWRINKEVVRNSNDSEHTSYWMTRLLDTHIKSSVIVPNRKDGEVYQSVHYPRLRDNEESNLIKGELYKFTTISQIEILNNILVDAKVYSKGRAETLFRRHKKNIDQKIKF